jgi:hypothetical protein
MFLGHFAVGLGAKKAVPKVSLGTLLFAGQFLDLLWPVLILAGVEHAVVEPGTTAVTPLKFTDYPISHSLFGALLWSILVGGVYYAIRRSAGRAFAVGACVVSHWLLDMISHAPDLPVRFSGGMKVGMGLWDSVAATLVVELALFAGGIALYLSATRSRDGIGTYGFWGLVAFLLITYVANLFGPPPPSMQAVGVAGNAMWLLVLWGWWVDRHRESVAKPVPVPPELE